MKLTKAQEAAITHGHLKHLTNRECADRFGVTYGVIYGIRWRYREFHENRQIQLI